MSCGEEKRTTEVTASSVMEASVKPLVGEDSVKLSDSFEIQVQAVPVRHVVWVREVVSYLNSLGKPSGAGEKHRLREIVEGGGLGIRE